MPVEWVSHQNTSKEIVREQQQNITMTKYGKVFDTHLSSKCSSVRYEFSPKMYFYSSFITFHFLNKPFDA